MGEEAPADARLSLDAAHAAPRTTREMAQVVDRRVDQGRRVEVAPE